MFDNLTMREADNLAEILKRGLENITRNHLDRTDAGSGLWIDMAQIRGLATDRATQVWRHGIRHVVPAASDADQRDFIVSGMDIGMMQYADLYAERRRAADIRAAETAARLRSRHQAPEIRTAIPGPSMYGKPPAGHEEA